MAFYGACRLGLSPGTLVSSHPTLVNSLASKMKLKKKCNFNSVRLHSSVVPLYHVALDILHMISPRCAALDFHMIAPWACEHASWRWFAMQLGDCSKSQIMLFNAIIIIIIIIISAAAA